MPDSKNLQMQDYTYTGPMSGVTLRGRDSTGRRTSIEKMLFSGKTVTLPVANRHVQRLIAQGFLKPVPVPAEAVARREPWPPPGRPAIDTAGMTEESSQGSSTTTPTSSARHQRRRASSHSQDQETNS